MFSRISILVFNDVEVLDFTGPFEVFNVAQSYWQGPPATVELVGPHSGPIRTVGGMNVQPDLSIDQCLQTDLLVLPGGAGTRPLLRDQRIMDWVKVRSHQSLLTLSVCTGALLLAKIGRLDQLPVTTHHSAFSELEALAPTASIQANQRFVDNGKLITAAGISAGIDAALYTVAKINHLNTALQTAQHMEYDWHPPYLPLASVTKPSTKEWLRNLAAVPQPESSSYRQPFPITPPPA